MSKRVNKLEKKIIGMMGITARNISKEPNKFGWPPACMGILYQPKRPLHNQDLEKKES